jgi:predicted adenylyl cyclase CyaB
MSLSYEIEIKSLLGPKERADSLRERITSNPSSSRIGKSKQLNHYFENGNLERLASIAGVKCLTPDKLAELKKLSATAKTFSVRTRQKDNNVFLVIKASADDTTSENGISRFEMEEKVSMPLEALDLLVIEAGFTYQAKWSREREEYSYDGITICLDKNAGYGWLAEFEKMVGSEPEMAGAREKLRDIMDHLGAKELSQERLQRMFNYYNENWAEYYGTDKTFSIE